MRCLLLLSTHQAELFETEWRVGLAEAGSVCPSYTRLWQHDGRGPCGVHQGERQAEGPCQAPHFCAGKSAPKGETYLLWGSRNLLLLEGFFQVSVFPTAKHLAEAYGLKARKA